KACCTAPRPPERRRYISRLARTWSARCSSEPRPKTAREPATSSRSRSAVGHSDSSRPSAGSASLERPGCMSMSTHPRDAAQTVSGLPPELPRHVLDHLQEGCQVIGRDYRYLYVNDAVARQGRTQKEALLGRTMQERYPGIESTEMFALLRHCMESGTDARMETEFVFPDGTIGWFDLHFEPVPEGVTILSTEITGRKQAELLIRRTVRALTVLSQTNQTLVRAVEEQRYLEDLCKIIVDTAGYPRVWLGLARDGELGTALTRGDGALPPRLVEFASRE